MADKWAVLFVHGLGFGPGICSPVFGKSAAGGLVASAARFEAAAVGRWESGGSSFATLHVGSGMVTRDEEQPVLLCRVVALDELLIEGPEALWWAFWDLTSSDHDWHVSTHIGFNRVKAV